MKGQASLSKIEEHYQENRGKDAVLSIRGGAARPAPKMAAPASTPAAPTDGGVKALRSEAALLEVDRGLVVLVTQRTLQSGLSSSPSARLGSRLLGLDRRLVVLVTLWTLQSSSSSARLGSRLMLSNTWRLGSVESV